MRELDARGLNQGTAGNISLRANGGVLITPSGVAPSNLSADKIVWLAMDGKHEQGEWKPSSEWPFHAAIYAARPDANAVVHTHSPHATALACLRHDIPAFHYTVAMAGGSSIRCAEYATFGSEELGARVVTALEDRRACLLANHGLVTLGEDLDQALGLAGEVEYLARLYGLSLRIGEPAILDDAEMARIVERFAEYGGQ